MKLSNMATVLRAAGLTVVETAGWATRGYAGRDLIAVNGVIWHHTATGRSAFLSNNAPTLSMCINGRSDLPGPLCNIVFGRDGTVYLVAAGLANHAGRGSAPGIPTDMGNYYLIGIEMESSGVAPYDWTADQIRVAPYLGAALEEAYLQDQAPELRLQLGHKEYSSEGKIDPAGWPGDMDGLRAAINKVLDAPAPVKPAGNTSTSTTTSTTEEITVLSIEDQTVPASAVKLGKDVPWYLKHDDMTHNMIVGQSAPGHFITELFVQGTGLLDGERLECTFMLITGTRTSGYYTQQVSGSADGSFKGHFSFNQKVPSGTRVEVQVRSNGATTALTVWGYKGAVLQ